MVPWSARTQNRPRRPDADARFAGGWRLALINGACALTDQLALPHARAYGVLAGILLGGRYWAGPPLGEPRPPINGPSRRRANVEAVESEANAEARHGLSR